MHRKIRMAARGLVGASVLAALAVAGIYARAFGSLTSHGANSAGYDLLEIANRSVPWLTALAVIAVCTWFAGRRVIAVAVSLALASAIVWGLTTGARGLALLVSHANQQAQAPAANSMILAVAGSARDVSPAWITLAVGALVLVALHGAALIRQRRGDSTAGASA